MHYQPLCKKCDTRHFNTKPCAKMPVDPPVVEKPKVEPAPAPVASKPVAKKSNLGYSSLRAQKYGFEGRDPYQSKYRHTFKTQWTEPNFDSK
jgi:hypothetical protein